MGNIHNVHNMEQWTMKKVDKSWKKRKVQDHKMKMLALSLGRSAAYLGIVALGVGMKEMEEIMKTNCVCGNFNYEFCTEMCQVKMKYKILVQWRGSQRGVNAGDLYKSLRGAGYDVATFMGVLQSENKPAYYNYTSVEVGALERGQNNSLSSETSSNATAASSSDADSYSSTLGAGYANTPEQNRPIRRTKSNLKDANQRNNPAKKKVAFSEDAKPGEAEYFIEVQDAASQTEFQEGGVGWNTTDVLVHATSDSDQLIEGTTVVTDVDDLTESALSKPHQPLGQLGL